MRLYHILLWFYPASFRSEYGKEMCHVFSQRRRLASNPFAVIGLWIGTVCEILVNAAAVHWDLLRQDLNYSARGMVRSPGFALMAVVVVALGIGANTAIFSITDDVLIRELPFADSDRLVKLWESSPRSARSEVSPPNYRDWRRMGVSFESMGAYVGSGVTLVGRGDPRRLVGAEVSTGVFAALNAAPLLGRSFTVDDERADAHGVVILSHGFWQLEFAGEPEALGTEIRFGDGTYTVVGVMPPGFYFPNGDTQFWTPLSNSLAANSDRGNNILEIVAKLKSTVSLDQARAEMSVIAEQIERAYPTENEGTGAAVVRLRDEVPEQSRLLLAALFGASLCVLLIACTNLASLMLARGIARQRELAVRSALGAGRERVVRQLLTESMVLAVLGGIAGTMLAMVSLPLLASLVPAGLPIGEATGVDFRILGFAVLLTGMTGLGFGVFPALRSCPADFGALRGKSHTRRERLRAALVVAEVTGSIVLLVSSGLLIRALWSIQAIDPGFRTDNVFAVNTPLSTPTYADRARRLDFYSKVLGKVRALPGVTDAAFISFLPMVTGGGIQLVNGVEDQRASLRFVTPGFFSSMGIQLRLGRDVSETDTLEASLASVVSESFVHRYLPGRDPIGQEFDFADAKRRIVGVVGDIRMRGLERDSEPQVYLPYTQMPIEGREGYMPRELVVKSSIRPDNLIPPVRLIVQQIDSQLPIEVRKLEDVVASQTGPRVVHIRVIGAFAALSLLLTGLGIHGLLSLSVSQRMNEIGLRMAIGARPQDILRMVLGEGVFLASVGCVLGLILAQATGRLIEALLAGVGPADMPSFIFAFVVAFVMTILGSLSPALRAIRVDPVTVIRME